MENIKESIYLPEEVKDVTEAENNDEAIFTENEDMPLNLEEFLCAHPVQGQTEKVVISERLKSYEFEIGEMTKKQYDDYISASVTKDNKGKIIKQNIAVFNEMTVINHCLYPNFKAVEFLQKVGVTTPSQALYKVLKLGEVDRLAEAILEFNGFDRDFKTLRKKAKN